MDERARSRGLEAPGWDRKPHAPGGQRFFIAIGPFLLIPVKLPNRTPDLHSR